MNVRWTSIPVITISVGLNPIPEIECAKDDTDNITYPINNNSITFSRLLRGNTFISDGTDLDNVTGFVACQNIGQVSERKTPFSAFPFAQDSQSDASQWTANKVAGKWNSQTNRLTLHTDTLHNLILGKLYEDTDLYYAKTQNGTVFTLLLVNKERKVPLVILDTPSRVGQAAPQEHRDDPNIEATYIHVRTKG